MRSNETRLVPGELARSVQKDVLMDWGFIVFVGTMLFFAALHQWPPDGRRWQREELRVKEQEQKRRRKEVGY
jgi:hypothetical protein